MTSPDRLLSVMKFLCGIYNINMQNLEDSQTVSDRNPLVIFVYYTQPVATSTLTFCHQINSEFSGRKNH